MSERPAPMSRKEQRAWSLVLGLEAVAFMIAITILALGDIWFGVMGMGLSGIALWRSWHLSGRGKSLSRTWEHRVRHLPLLLLALVGFVALLVSAIVSFTQGNERRGGSE